MRVRVFEAATEAEALAMAQRYFGADAVIISSRPSTTPHHIRVIAALEEKGSFFVETNVISFGTQEKQEKKADPGFDEGEPVASSLDEEDLLDDFDHMLCEPVADDVVKALKPAIEPKFIPELQKICAEHDLSERMMWRLRDLIATMGTIEVTDTGPAMAEGTFQGIFPLVLSAIFDFQPLWVTERMNPIALVGPPGAGKTVTAAKILVAATLAGHKIKAVCVDTERAGGYEQLAAFTDLLGVSLYCVEDPATLAELVDNAPLDELMVIDCMAGHPNEASSAREIKALTQDAGIEPILVAPVEANARYLARLALFYRDLGCRRMIATRADLGVGLGAIFEAAASNGISLAALTNSDQVTEGLHPLTAEEMARWLCVEPGARRETEESPPAATATMPPASREKAPPRPPRLPEAAAPRAQPQRPQRPQRPEEVAPRDADMLAGDDDDGGVEGDEADYQLVADALRVARIDAALAERRNQRARNGNFGGEEKQAIPHAAPHPQGARAIAAAAISSTVPMRGRLASGGNVAAEMDDARIATLPLRISPGGGPAPITDALAASPKPQGGGEEAGFAGSRAETRGSEDTSRGTRRERLDHEPR